MTDTDPSPVLNPTAPEPAGRLAAALMGSIREFVREAVDAGDSPETVRADALAEIPELLQFFGISLFSVSVDGIRLAVSAIVDRALADAMAGSIPAMHQRLITWAFRDTVRVARERLQAGRPLKAVVAELTGETPGEVARLLGFGPESPDRADAERSIQNMLEDACWFAVKHPEPAV